VGSTPTRRTSFKASRVCGGMADSLDSVSRGFTALWVRLPPDAPTQISSNGSRRLLAMQGTGVRLSQSAPRPSRCSRVNALVEEWHTRLAQTKEFAGSNPARRTRWGVAQTGQHCKRLKRQAEGLQRRSKTVGGSKCTRWRLEVKSLESVCHLPE
jgi:hypothetical protein